MISFPVIRLNLVIMAIGFATVSFAQNKYPENEPITNMALGIYYQSGPGSGNDLYQWSYPYGTKLTVNVNEFRNFEIATTIYPKGELIFRQWNPSGDNIGWQPWRKILMCDHTGNLGLGGKSHSQYRLYVHGNSVFKGSIWASEIRVKNENWPDYVFEPDFPLCELEEYAAYLKENNHLPGVPPRKKVMKEGVELGELNYAVVENLEKLTLYLLEHEKQIQELKNENDSLKTIIKQIINQ